MTATKCTIIVKSAKAMRRALRHVVGPIVTPIAGPMEYEALITKREAVSIAQHAEWIDLPVMLMVSDQPFYPHMVRMMQADNDDGQP